MPSYLRSWTPLAVAITGLCIAIYVTGQQVYRQSFDDSQVQMAEDAAARISGGATATSTVPKSAVDISASVAPFLVVYNGSGAAIISSGLIDGRIPVPPASVFAHAASSYDDRLTLEPQSGIRIAVVVKALPEGKGFVLAGRNMRHVEERIQDLGNTVLAAWIILMLSTFLSIVIVKKYMRDHNGYIRMSI